jgi:hypothetical protein
VQVRFNQQFSSYFVDENIRASAYKGSSLKQKNKKIKVVPLCEISSTVLIKCYNDPLNLGMTDEIKQTETTAGLRMCESVCPSR